MAGLSVFGFTTFCVSDRLPAVQAFSYLVLIIQSGRINLLLKSPLFVKNIKKSLSRLFLECLDLHPALGRMFMATHSESPKYFMSRGGAAFLSLSIRSTDL